MKNFRESILIKPLCILLSITFLNLTFYSCSKDNGANGADNGGGGENYFNSPSKEFNGSVVEMITDSEGRYDLTTEISSQGEDFDLSYEFHVVDQSGNPVEGITITYNQIDDKCLIYITDEEGKYASTYFIGTPRELETYFLNSYEKSGPYLGTAESSLQDDRYKDSNSFIVLGIVAIITVISIGVAEVGFLLNAYKVQNFYLTDYVSETEDYILYCKNFSEIAELMKARTNMVLNLTSIFVSFISLGGSGASLTIELTNSIGTVGVDKIREELLGQAFDAWGVAMDELAGKKVAVKVYPYEEDQSFSGARNLFATYTIEYENEICSGDGIISGTVTDAATGYPIEGAIIKLSGEDISTDITNEDGNYSFEALIEGGYSISAEKSGYITEQKNIDFDGSSAAVNFVLSQVLASDEYRVVLTWGQFPEDMDIHLFTENGEHIYYGNKGSLNYYPYIELDVDDLHSYGPETITIGELQTSGIHVHNYSGNPDITTSESLVKIYNGNSLLKEYTVPISGNGDWWHVFDIDSYGNITDQDYLHEGGKYQLKKKELSM